MQEKLEKLILNPACKNFTLFCKEPSTKTKFEEKKIDGISEYFGQDIDHTRPS